MASRARLIGILSSPPRGSGLNLVVAAIALWNTVYLERAINALQERSYVIDQKLLAHISPLKWEHINLTGDYHWRRGWGLRNRKLRPLVNQSGLMPTSRCDGTSKKAESDLKVRLPSRHRGVVRLFVRQRTLRVSESKPEAN